MSHKQDSRNFKPAERARLRILFLALPILLLIAAVCIITWYVRRDTPGRTVRNTMNQISSLDESAILQIASSGEGEDSSAALEALGCVSGRAGEEMVGIDRAHSCVARRAGASR